MKGSESVDSSGLNDDSLSRSRSLLLVESTEVKRSKVEALATSVDEAIAVDVQVTAGEALEVGAADDSGDDTTFPTETEERRKKRIKEEKKNEKKKRKKKDALK